MNSKDPRTFLAPVWAQKLAPEFQAPYMEKLREFLRKEYGSGKEVFPPRNDIFRSLKLVDYPSIKVVILGQDPYHGLGQANGLAFAVRNGISPPPSLQNIFKEVTNNIGKQPQKTDLEGWAAQGVLLLNTVLTVRAHEAFSHRNQGWEQFTDKVIELISERGEPVVFLLWGSAAQAKEKIIGQRHHILKAPHPSPLSAHRGFLGCQHFLKTNAILQNQYGKEIDWALS